MEQTRDTISKIGAATGTKFVMDAQVSGGTANAAYVDTTGTVHIAADAANPLMVVVKHELTHRMQDLAPEEYAAFRSYAVEVVNAGTSGIYGAATAVEAKQNQYYRLSKGTISLSVEQAMDEIAADFTEQILTDEKALNDFINHVTNTTDAKTKKMGQRFFEAVRNFINKVKSVFKGDTAKQNAAAREQFGATMEQLERAEKLWKDAYRAAEQRAQQEKAKQSEARQSERKSAETAASAQFSMKEDVLSLDGVDWMSDYSSIKEQLAEHSEELRRMSPVAVVEYTPKSAPRLKSAIMGEISKLGGKDVKRNSVSFEFDEKGVGSILSHAKSHELRAAALASPYVVKYGELIAGQKNHENTGLTTLTYAAPVIINGKTVNVGVAVQFQTNGRPRAVSVGLQSGGNFKIDIEKAPKGLDSRVSRYDQGTSLPTMGASAERISQPGGDVKGQFGLDGVTSEEFYDTTGVFSLKETDEDTLKWLNSQETITTYKTMQLVDGKLYPPMATRINGKFEDASALGEWERAVEHPELIRNGNKFKLDKGKGQGSIEAAYNPYMHSSNLVINDQFTGAYARDNLVTVECEVPASEATSGYRAQHAKDAVGWHSWHTGTVASGIRKANGTERQVFLSRWIKPVRIVPDAEVAAMYKELLDGTNVAVPDNVVTPSLLAELKKAGVEIKESGKVKNARFSLKETDSEGNALSAEQVEFFKDSTVRDESGRLLAMYHGTNADKQFTVFNTYGGNFGLFGVGAYFTADESVAETYTQKGKGSSPRVYKCYLNITNPLDMDKAFDLSQWDIDDSELKGYLRNAKTNEEMFRQLEEYCADMEMVKWEAEEFISDFIRYSGGYDGITHIGGGRYGAKDGARHRVYIALDPEQIKLVDNRAPTSDPDIRYSLKEFNDGTRFVAVDTDQVLFDNLSEKEKTRKAIWVIRNRFVGKVIGRENTAYVNRATAVEYGYPAKRISGEIRDAKMRTATELANLLDAGRNFRTSEDGEDGHIHLEAVGGFTYFDVIFKVGTQYYSGVINIENTKRGRRLKDITKIRNVTQGIINSYGINPQVESLRDASLDIITDPAEEVNTDFSLKTNGQPTQADILRENARLKEVNEALREQFKVTTFAKVDKGALRDFTRKLLKDYSSNADLADIEGELETLYNTLSKGVDAEGQPITWEKAYKLAYDTARAIVEDATVVEDEPYTTYAELREHLRTTKITLDPEYSADLVGYEGLNDFRKVHSAY